MKNQIDAGFIQDAYHYSLAMQGNQDSAFPAETLQDRLDASAALKGAISRLSFEGQSIGEWDDVSPRPDMFETVEQVVALGKQVQSLCESTARRMGIDPRSGDALDETENLINQEKIAIESNI